MTNLHLPLIGTALFATGLLTLFYLLFHLAWSLYVADERTLPSRRKRVGLYRLVAMLISLILIFAGQLSFWFSSQLRNYTAIQPKTPLCTLDIYTPADHLPRLIYSTLNANGNELVEVFPMRDSRMRVTGEIIDWPEWLKKFGAERYFKLTGVEFVDIGEWGDTSATFSIAIHRGSMPIYRRLSGWPSRLSLASTKTVHTPILTADTNTAYNVVLRNDHLVLE